jgi:hypothetical protein
MGNKLNHPGAWLRLRKDEISKLVPREWSLLIEDHPAQILLEGHPSLFMRLEDQSVALLHVCPRQLEVFGCAPTGEMVPAVGQKDIANV